MANPSTIWGSLATPNPASGSVPFIASDNATIITDVINFAYDQINKQLIVTNGISPDVQLNQAGMASPVTVNHVAGRVSMAAGSNTILINNSLVTVNSIIFIQQRALDATATQFRIAGQGAGVFSITANTNATAQIIIDFMIINGQIVTA